MSTKSTIKFARRRQGITNYEKRFNLLKARKPRLVVRQTNTKIIAQVIDFSEKGDKVVASALSSDLAGLGWTHSVKSTPAAYLTGMLISERAKSKNVKECVMDLGLKTITKGSRVFAVLKGAVDGGLAIPHSPENFPADDRVQGKHIAAYKKTDVSKDIANLKSKIVSVGGKTEPKKKEGKENKPKKEKEAKK